MSATMRVAVGGVLTVMAYAAWAAVVILVLDPLAAMPGMSLGEIYAQMDAAGETMPVGMALGWLGFGVALAVAAAAAGVRGRRGAEGTAVLFLVVLAFGALGYFAASFGPGMNVADTFSVGGGAHTAAVVPLIVISLLSAGAAVGLTVRRGARRRTAAA